MNWDDLKIFLAVAEHGSLSGAARALQISQPTVGRRLRALEEKVAARLFDRLPDGFLLTAQGTALLPHAEEMARAAEGVERQRASLADAAPGEVRISVAEETALFLSERLDRLRATAPNIVVELAVSHVPRNLSRREADLLIRFCIPDYGGLIGRKLGVMGYAVYGSHSYLNGRNDNDLFEGHNWASWDEEHQDMPGAQWLHDRLGGRSPEFRTNDAMAMAVAVRHGMGLGVLPCFVGDTDPSLRRLTPPLSEVTPSLYVLVHPDLRRVPAVRIMMDSLIALFKEESAILAGDGLTTAGKPIPVNQVL